MNLYITTAGLYAGTQASAGKGHKAVEVPTDKQGLIAYLNGLMGDRAEESRTGPTGGDTVETYHTVPEGRDGPLCPLPDAHAAYSSPISARTVIAGIDAGMVSAAVGQFDGRNLGLVMAAGIERMAQLAHVVGDTVGGKITLNGEAK